MKLCIAEKPSVAREIATIVKAGTKKNGYFEGNGYYVSWTYGHLCTLKTPDDYKKEWRKWNMQSLPIIPPRFSIKLIDIDNYKRQFETIRSLVEKSEEVINCGDAGIEGELIQRWVLLKAQCKVPVKRLWISSLTEEALIEGFENLKDSNEYDSLFAAGNARAVGDWLLGINASRLYTVKYSNGKGVLSVGRVQTPTLALIVNRHKEIIDFVPQPYWEIKTTYKEVVFNSTKGKYTKKQEAEAVLEEIKKELFEIVDYTKKKGKEAPPKLFDLTALQVECNKKYNFSADETLKYIQSLYEKKLVTYPRVDTTFLPTDMYPKIEGILRGIKPYANFTAPLLQSKIPKSKKVFDDKKITDHHAIIPTGVNPGAMLLEEKKVYDSIARRFIAVFYPDCIVSNTTVKGMAGETEFKATGKVIVEPGWRVLFPKKQSDRNNAEEQIMPEFTKGEKGEHLPDLLEKETTPPKYYTEASLLRAMETAGKIVKDDDLRDALKENGIGRPSTRANIIETLFKRKYIVRQRKNLVPTATGVDLIDTIENNLLKSVELTGMWENKLRKIERNEYEAATFLDEMKQMVTEIVTEVKQERGKNITIIEEKKAEEKKSAKKKVTDEIICPVCGKGQILKGNKAYGCSEFKNGCKFVVAFEQYGKKLTDKQLQTLISKGKTNAIKGFVIDGEKSDGKLQLTKSGAVEFLPQETSAKKKEEEKLICPKCKKGEMLKGKNAYGCSRYKEGCNFVIPFDALKEKSNSELLTKSLLQEFI